MTDQPPVDVDVDAYRIAMESLAAEFPKYADDPSIYRSACEGMIANLCKARGVKARNIVVKIQNNAWNAAVKADMVRDPREVLRLARDEINAMREMNKADDKHLLDKTNAKKRLGVETMPREKQEPLEPTPGKLTGGLFGNKPAEPASELMSDDINEVIPREQPPASAPAADKAPAEAPEHVRNHILKHVAEHYGLNRDAKGQEAYELGKRVRMIFGATLDQIVPKHIASIADADVAMNTYWSTHNGQEAIDAAAKPEPAALPEPPQPRVNYDTGELPTPQPSAMVAYQAPAVSLLPEQARWEIMREQAGILIKSGFLPSSIKTPEQAIAIMMMGEALNIKPIVALTTINVIAGKPTIPPQMMLAKIRQSGQLQNMSITDDGTMCSVTLQRKGETPHTETFSMADAQALKTTEWVDGQKRTIPLAEKANWKQQPANMRKWRAISAACRVVFPDVIWGMYTPEEMNPDIIVED